MIVAVADDRLLVITQNDHAHFASELLSLWRTDGLPEHPRRRELLFAAREHDNGWREADAAPICRATGQPHDFMTVPRELRWEIWHRGTARFVTSEPYAALLILRHALHLHRSHRGDEAWDDVLQAWQRIESQLLEQHAFDPAAVELDYRWIDLSDELSLAACNRWTDPLVAHGIRAELRTANDSILEGNTLFLDPFPLAGTTTLKIACRLIPDRAYDGDVDLGTELAAARWRQCAVRVAAPERPAADQPL